jgi:formylmethanofuran dehydrogenase subunit E
MENKDYKELVKFHGHSCPGLAIGYRAVLTAQENGFNRSEDEELIAIVENNSCSVDAVQFMLSCTFGKGNLFFKDFGKQAFTIIKRDSKEAIRISLKPNLRDNITREEFFKLIMELETDKIFNIKKFHISERELPEKARIHNSIICDNCHEPTMETKIKILNSKKLCIPCYEKNIN